MSLSIERHEALRAAVVHMDGDLDLAAVPSARTVFESLIDTGFNNIVIDLSGVEYADSTALGLLVWLDRRLQECDGKVLLAGANRNIRRILEVSRVVSVAPTLSEERCVTSALASIEPTKAPAPEQWIEEMAMAADVGQLALVRDRICAMLEPLEFSPAALFDIKVALGEALANAVRHGSPGVAGEVKVRIRAFAEKVVLEVEDSGSGFDGDHICSDDLYASGGRGIMFMRALMDRVEFAPAPAGGTMVTLVKHRTPLEVAETGD